MKIAICDDSKIDLQYVSNLVEEFFKSKQSTVKIDKFLNPRILLNKLTEDDNQLYDLFILGNEFIWRRGRRGSELSGVGAEAPADPRSFPRK